jgi:HK97 family phage prohead protease
MHPVRRDLSQPVFKEASLSLDSNPSPDESLRFIASTEARDRYGDIVRADGWQLDNYKRNPIALFGHNHEAIVGTATKIWKEGKQLLTELRLAAAGTAPVVDYVRALVQQKILKAVSVGFLPSKHKEVIEDGRFMGYEFIEQELFEISLVAVPANQEALAIAKSLNLSYRDRALVLPANKGFSAQRARLTLESLRASRAQ